MSLVNEDNFKCILDISDPEFLAKETVYRACCSACLLLEDDPDTCIVNVQRALEITLKYICTKFLDKTPYNLSELLSDNSLKLFIGNNSDGSVVTYLELAGGAARKTGNKGKHENALGAHELVAESNLSALAYVMPSLCDIISNAKPKKESTVKTEDDDKKTIIEGKIIIRIGQHAFEGTDQLEVTLFDTNFDVKNSAANKKIEYSWKYEKSTGNWIKKRIPFFSIGEKDFGKTISLQIRHDDYSGYLSKSFSIKKEESSSKETLPKLKGDVVLEKKYDEHDGKPYLEAVVHDVKTEEPLLYRWGFKQGDGTYFFNPQSGKPARKDNSINWLKEEADNGSSNIGKRLICRVTCDGYSKEGISSKYYHALEHDDFKYKIVGHLKIDMDDETNSLIAKLEEANVGSETPKFSWSIDGADYSEPEVSPRYELSDESDGKVFVCKSTCTPKFVGEVISDPYEVKREEHSDKPALDGNASITREKESGKMALRLNRENGEVEVEQLLYFWCVSNELEKPDQDGYKIGGPFFELEQEHIGKYVHGYISSKGYSGTLDAKRGPITREDLLLDINGSLKIKPNLDENGKPFIRARLSKSNPDTVFIFSWSADGEELAEKSDILYLSRDYINKIIRCTVSAKDRNGERDAEYLVEDSLFPSENITAVVSVDLRYEKDSDGKVSDAYLEASVVECNIQNPILTFDWFADNIPVSDARESKFIISADRHINKTIRCDVHFEGYEEKFSAEHIVTEEELVISQSQTDPTTKPVAEPEPITDPKPAPEPEPIPEPEPEAVIPKHVLFELVEARDYKATRYFQSIRGQIQYFACNYDDSYVLNSYEKMDYSHFLYRFLKEQGFERVVTVDKREGKFDLFAFDKLSELSFANPAEFRGVTRNDDTDRLDQRSLKRFYDKLAEGRTTLTRPGKAALSRSSRSSESSQSSSADPTAEFGKRRINLPSITGKEIFQSTVSQYICPALRACNAKTCIVLPIGLLVTNEYLTPEIASLIISALNDAKKEVASNVLLITASRTEDFNAIMEQSYSLFSELEPEINKAYVNAGNGERFGAVLVKRLIEENRILISEECPRADEIANILLKKTLIDKEPSFKELSASKIYTLSDYMYKSEEFNSSVNEILGLPEGTNKLTIDFIENILANKRIAEGLVEKSEELKDRQPVKYNNLPSAYLSRVIGEVERSIISKAERDEELNSILLEMDELVGMEAVKIQVLEQMNSMESDLRRLSEGKIKVLPYQNMMFVGPPGTGKTTVAQLVARLMCAKGILPKETTVVRTPAHYNNTGTVGALKDALQADIESAAGGVILFDEFYNFNQGHSAGNMANDALAAIMDGADRYKGRICIIIAGYEKQVMDTLAFNPGAERRFPNKIAFTSFSTADVVEIFRRYAISNNFKEPGKDVLDAITVVVENEKKAKGDRFTNGGFVTDKLFEAVKRKYIMRKGTDYILTVGDVHEAFPNDSADQTAGQNKMYTRPSKELFVSIEGDKFEFVKDIKDFKKLSRNAILRINTSAGKVGTAFLIHPEGYAITCNHVIVDNNKMEAEAITATLRFFSGNKSISEDVEAKVLMRDPHLDMAIIKIDPQNESIIKMLQNMELEHLPYLRITDERNELEDLTGEDSIICGFPNAKETAQARTIEISGMTKNPAKIDCYATSDNAYGGDSGAPIILADSRRVIGILKGSLKDKDGRGYEGDNFIIPIHYFWKDMVK